MKKMKIVALTTLTAVLLSACGNRQSGNSSTTAGQPVTQATVQTTSGENSSAADSGGETQVDDSGSDDNGTKSANGANILIAYFTVPETDGVDTVGRASRVAVDAEVLGNHQFVAQIIQETVGGDLFRIETEQEYPGTHNQLLDFAHDEKAKNARPAIASKIENPDQYDIIFIGYPNWNADLPMPLYSFLEENDFSGKTIIPFVVHGGSGFSATIQTIAGLQPGAEVMTNGFTVSRDSVSGARADIERWAESLGLK